ncbi:DNA ligase D [Pseudomonas sp. CFBP 13727]|uniref:DNA ligase D n=1 Tax=Pseudomonas sp. CFBP 13727 TaxID=2775295 RepID=UPI00177B54A3|nr:DNA ligase D [Pseudomonas sp. CFBP 13727]MBD8625021.1 DNA ligase D [Pseudomonas sp. CFBP 13727]
MSKALEEYNRKRDFDATPEPSGGARSGKRGKAAQALQFCIQKHDASHLHYDFRLELDGTLKSWAVPKGPSLDPKARRLAVHVEDHPLDYASFEGNIPEGHYGAGDVIVWDRGTWIPEGDPRQGYEKGKLKFVLQGEKLAGAWNLVKTHMPGKREQWFLIKSKDQAARPLAEYDVLEAQPDSVLSERTLVPRKRKSKVSTKTSDKSVAKPAAKPRATGKGVQLQGARAAALPASLKPELATLVDTAPDGDWRYEIKFDGYRIVARIEDAEVRLFTRNGHDWTARMPRQAKALAALGLQSAWLDGEVVVTNEQGVPDFQALQNAFEEQHSGDIVFYLFDMPYLNGMDLREVPVEQRRSALAKVLEANEDDALKFSDDFADSAESLLASACQMNMEGLIGKRVGSPYVSRRSSDWIKLKCKRRQEFVIVGYTEPKGSRSAFGALLLGLHDADSGELRFAGKVGTGFSEATLRSLHAQLQSLETDEPALGNPPKGADARGVHWLQPTLLAEVAYAEMTRDGAVRHAVFHGLRTDKPARKITADKPAAKASDPPRLVKPKKTPRKAATQADDADLVGQVRITHPERVIDAASGTTKMQLAEYYGRISPWLLPHLKQRPVALVRAPDGVGGELFFQKHAGHLAIPHIVTFDKKEAGQAAMVINDGQALLGAVQMGTLELHTWNATTKDFDHPDRFVLDLDPDPALPWKSMVEATQLTQTLLDELGLASFLKTSGGKGMHVVVPITRKLGWDEVKAFSRAVVEHMARLMPERFSAVSGPKNRVGKIFIDYLRNGLGATTACAYAARARDGLPVSVPVTRDEVAHIKGGDHWNIDSVLERLAEMDDDPWADFFTTRQSITVAMRKKLGLD